MDDGSCGVDFEIVPVDSDRTCTESSDVKLSPGCIKVCVLFYTLFVPST